jgi:hypothetical protein
MHVGLEEVDSIRQEMFNLLCQQMATLDSPFGPTDDQLKECYLRQLRVQELREKLQAASDSEANRTSSNAA